MLTSSAVVMAALGDFAWMSALNNFVLHDLVLALARLR